MSTFSAGGQVWQQETLPLSIPASVQRKRTLSLLFRAWPYRLWLLIATTFLTMLLLNIQNILSQTTTQMSVLQIAVQWAELSWLTTVPMAVFLWCGWFLFAEITAPAPKPAFVPYVKMGKGLFSYSPPVPVKLVFRFVTRGDNIEVLQESLRATHQAFLRYPFSAGPYRIEVVTERALPLANELWPNTYVYVVPAHYQTPNHSRFKARALSYLQEQVYPRQEEWFIYLDEESMIDEQFLAGVYSFIRKALEGAQRAIGQGAILYDGGNCFFRGADALRTADDLGRFRLQYGLGIPLFGIHGSFVVVRGQDDKQLSFDVGYDNSITEDAAWALRAWSRGYRFAWVDGLLREQPPQRVMDFVKQRSRWLSGIRKVLRDKQIPLRYRFCLGVFTLLWQLSFLPLLVAAIALFVHVSPFGWMRVPANFAWATFFLAYLQGIDFQAKHTRGMSIKRRILAWLLVVCNIWYALLEALGVLHSVWPKQGFFVISKPHLGEKGK